MLHFIFKNEEDSEEEDNGTKENTKSNMAILFIK